MSAIVLLEPTEIAALTEQEAIIERGLQTFYEVGSALLAIRDARLYRADHPTFEDYCRNRWGIVASRARQLIASAEVVANLKSVTVVTPDNAIADQSVSTTVDILPANEAQARPLAALPAEQQAEAWQEAVTTAPEGKVTAAHVKATVERLAPSQPRPVAPMRYERVPDPDAGAWTEEEAGEEPDEESYSRPVPPATKRAELEEMNRTAFNVVNTQSGGALDRMAVWGQFLRGRNATKAQLLTLAAPQLVESVDGPGDDERLREFLDELERWSAQVRAVLPRRIRALGGTGR